jgi:hypothetical protein
MNVEGEGAVHDLAVDVETLTAVTAAGCGTWPRGSRPSTDSPGVFEGQPELIDHLLISHVLLNRLDSVDADATGLASIGMKTRPVWRALG